MAKASKDFGKLFSAACSYISHIREISKKKLYEIIAEKLDRSGKTVENIGLYGNIPTDEHLLKIATFFYEQEPSFFSKHWMDDFLSEANCSIKDMILKTIYPIEQYENNEMTVKRNLPAPIYFKYVQRNELENEILFYLKNSSVLFISSFGGNGKSSIAYYIAKKYVDKEINSNIDTIIWISDKGKPGHTTLNDIYIELVKTLGLDNVSQMGTQEIEQLVDSLLNKHNILFIIDNFETITDASIARFINEKMRVSCKVIITCRQKLDKFPLLENCVEIEVAGMIRGEIKELIKNRINNIWKYLSPYIDEIFWDKLMEITGGNPFAAQTICGGLNNIIRNGGDFEVALYEYSNYKSQILSGLFENLLEKQWQSLSSDAKQTMILINYFPKNVSNVTIKKIFNWQKSKIEIALGQCISLNLLDLVILNEGKENYIRYSQHPLVYSFVKKIIDNGDFSFLRNDWIKYFLNLTKDIGFAYNRVTDFSIFDIEGEFEALEEVLAFCEKEEKYKEFISISENTKYYFYIRGLWKKGVESIHIKRADIAKILGDKQAEFDALVYQINIASKRKEIIEVSLFLKRTEDIMHENELLSESIIKFYHAKALYLSSIGDDKSAIDLWNKNLSDYQNIMNSHDYNANIRWKARSLLRCGNENQKIEAVQLLKEASKNAERENFLRGYLDANLTLADYYLKINDVVSADKIVKEIESRILEPRDNKYIAELYIVKAKMEHLKENSIECRNNLKLAIEFLEKSLHYNRIQELKYEFDLVYFDS